MCRVALVQAFVSDKDFTYSKSKLSLPWKVLHVFTGTFTRQFPNVDLPIYIDVNGNYSSFILSPRPQCHRLRAEQHKVGEETLPTSSGSSSSQYHGGSQTRCSFHQASGGRSTSMILTLSSFHWLQCCLQCSGQEKCYSRPLSLCSDTYHSSQFP